MTSRVTTVIKKQKQKKPLTLRLQPRKINRIRQIWRFDWEGLELERARILELTLEIQKVTDELELECNAKGWQAAGAIGCAIRDPAEAERIFSPYVTSIFLSLKYFLLENQACRQGR
jgi:hypothetical protein